MGPRWCGVEKSQDEWLDALEWRYCGGGLD
jgi:hypothetical protein